MPRRYGENPEKGVRANPELLRPKGGYRHDPQGRRPTKWQQWATYRPFLLLNVPMLRDVTRTVCSRRVRFQEYSDGTAVSDVHLRPGLDTFFLRG
jgi:hypothetical protein